MAQPVGLVTAGGSEQEHAALLWYLRPRLDVRVLAEAADVAAAMGPIRDLEPDAVLCEPIALGTDRPATLRQLVSTGTPVVVWTSSLLPGEAESFFAAGAAAVLRKGEDLPDLMRVLTRLGSTRQRRTIAIPV